jgi:hypothetical protein
MPIILAIWKAEIGRMEVRGQPGQIVCETCPRNLQNTQSKMDRREVWLSKHEALSAKPSPTKKERKKRF